MTKIILLGILLGIITRCDSTKCFECQNVPFPHDCLKLTVCNSDEVCFTEQVVKVSGNVAFNSGCLSKSRCSAISTPLIGKRSSNIVNRRSTDITTCKECCNGDFCNLKGCGTHEIPLDQRGPYCYTCDVQDPKDCTDVTICGDSTKCFECQNVPFPHDCLKLTVCNSDEVCFTEQVVKVSGNVAFNSGCLSKSRCSAISTPLIGKRSSNIVNRRSTDITTCKECCNGDFCNLKGCGTHEIPLDQRGPYCYTCDVQDPKDCTDVTICGKNELCMIYNPVELSSRPDTIYRGQCETKAACDAISRTFSGQNCDPICCNSDFCNDRCGAPSNVTMTTSYPLTTDDKTNVSFTTRATDVTISTKETTQIPTTTSSVQPATCNTSGGYLHLHNSEADLCVHIVTRHNGDWNNAQAACKKEGSDLVILDTPAKALLLTRLLAGHHTYDHVAYWIGASISPSSNQFSWVNQFPVNKSVADWDQGQPNHDSSNTRACVCMCRNSHDNSNSFKWHDRSCENAFRYICER